jgi:hypothetical protein
MRSVSVRARRGLALLILLVAVTAVPAVADDPAPGTVVLQGRIHMPPGLTGNEELRGRIHVPIGVAAEEETPSVWELFLVWLQHRIHIPVG